MHNYGHWKKTLALLVMSALSLGASSVDAMPEGGVIRSGEGAVSQNGREMTIRQDSGRLAMDWTNFNVGKDETVRFQQPGKDALALNRVTGNQQSVIDGSLLSNGHVLLVNPNGVVIGKNASIDVGGLVASTAHVKDNFMKDFGNSTGSFNLGGVSDGKIINEGTINAEGGLVALHAAKVENSGTITSNGGSVLMAAADTLTLTPDTDGKLNFTVDGKVAEASALNKGGITADGGTIVMTADSASDVMSTVVNNEGTLQARTLRKNEKGQILLEGNDKGQVEVSGTLDASGTENGQDAGNIKVIGQKTIVHDGTNLLARGDVNGGKIETSGDVLDLGDNLNIDAKGVNGKAGEWLLDPLAVYINDDDKDPTAGLDSGTDKKTLDKSDITSDTKVLYNDPNKDGSNGANADSASVGVTWIKGSFVNEMLTNGTDVKIQAASTNGAASIILNSVINPTVGGSKKEATFTLEANRNIEIHKDIKANSEGGKLNVVLNANTNNDGIGAVIIDADIETNGGYFISASGGKGEKGVRLESNGSYGFVTGNLTGEADHGAGTVGTHFGNTNTSGESGEKGDRWIITNGGAVTLNGEVSIGLNGGSLIIDTTARDGKSDGKVTVTGIVNSGNAYTLYTENSDKLNKLFESLAEITDENDPLYKYTPRYYLSKGLVPAYHFEGVNYEREMEADGVTPKKVNGQYVYVKDKDGNYKYTTEAYTFGKDEKHYAFHELKSGDTASAGWTYVDTEPSIDTQNVQWYISGKAGTGYRAFIMTEGTMSFQQYLYFLQKSQKQFSTNYPKGTNPENYSDAEKLAIIKELMINNWFVAEKLAQGETNGGAEVGDTYLATLTTRLENSLNAPDYQMPLYIGGRGSGIRDKNNDLNNNPYQNMPVDPTHQSGFYWVTGPEGQGNGTLFYDMRDSKFQASTVDGKKSDVKGKEVYGYTNWSSYENAKGTAIFWQPDNSSPFLTVGYGRTSLWDDAAIDGATTVGFIQEKNLANSSLNIKAGSGDVKLQGDIGKAKALDTVNIESKGAVTVGTDNNNVTDYYHGTIYADHGVYISGGTVSVGGEIHSGTTDTTASASDIKTRTDGYQNEAFQLDNVTIKSAGDLTVHGVESDGYMGSDDTLNGGKISLTSTGDSGKITLGAGVDYDGNATAGTLAAASAANGAVVIDAQGSQGSLVNSTTGKYAITTGTKGKGTWQVYVNSPSDYGTSLGDNLVSGTNAQWTAKSTANTNSSTNTLAPYTDTSRNKFIFQVTPVITISSGIKQKTYGDILTDIDLNKLLETSATYTKSDGRTEDDVTKYSNNFKEDGYLNYIVGADGKTTGISNIKTSSDAAPGTATRTNGDVVESTNADGTKVYKTDSEGNRPYYVFTVDKNGSSALYGYDLETNNGEIEILKRQASITGKGTQTYGDTDGTIKNWKADTPTNIAKGSTVTYDTSVKSGSAYTDNQKGRNTADFGTYENSVSFDNLKITDAKGNEVNIADNYDLTTTGTIDVAKAKLTVNTDGKTTTYGTVDEDYKSSLDKTTQALNGDKEADLLKELGLTYTLDPKDSAYIDSDGDGKYDRTNHVKYTSDGKDYDSYTLDVANTNTLKNYEVTVNDSTVTLERAKAVVDTDKVTTDYGKVDTSYTSHFKDALNGDKEEDLLKQLDLSYSTDAYKDADHTNNVKDGGYDLKVQAKGSLTYNDYDVTVNDSNVTLNKVNLTVNPEDIHRIYGQAKEVQEDAKTSYNLSGFANGDTKDTVDATNKDGKTIEQLVKVTNDVSKALKDDGTHTQNASTDGYDMGTTAFGNLTNYNIVVGEQKKVYLDKAKLTVSVNDTSTTYGQNQWTPYTYTLAGNTNGDTVDTVKNNQISVTYTNGGEKSDTSNDAVKTQNAGKYDLIGKFTLSGDTATNYEIDTDNSKLTGTAEVKKADLTLSLKNVSTTYGQGFDENTYGYKKDKSDLQGLTNGDDAKAITDVLRDSDFTYVNGGAKSDPNNENVKTQDAGSSYQITGTTSKTLDNYNIMVIPGNSTVSKKAITVENEMNQIYGEKDSTTFSEIVLPDLANGDKLDTSKDSKFTISLSEDPNTPYNQNRKNRDTADVGEYADSLKYSGGGIVHSDGTNAYENYDVTIKGIAKVHPKDIYTEVIGKGSTLNDLTWTILKDPKDQMANGDSVNFTYKPGNLISYDDQTFDVNSFINDTQTYGSTTDADPYGKNYIFHSTGKIQLTFNPIVKPDVWAHSGGYRPRNKIETSLPVFRVEDAKVGQYGTYGVEHREDEDKLVLSATGMRLPEPDQVPDEERTFTTTLSTEEGSGTFKLEYNGVSLKVHPQDKKAEEVVRAGDKTKNVSLSEKALCVGYTEMGLDLIDLKGVYIYFN
jgi:filamentous hemagglutinin family protein|nr:filamentous hemagglutinin N-terminal domain-containing protein [uncultured Dialister sp.]